MEKSKTAYSMVAGSTFIVYHLKFHFKSSHFTRVILHVMMLHRCNKPIIITKKKLKSILRDGIFSSYTLVFGSNKTSLFSDFRKNFCLEIA
jgi:hypothetical protein